jgi:hypothetical protein
VLHPNKGEGEHLKPRKTLKGPQILTATLLFCYPLLCAQAATASTSSSSFHKPLTAQPFSYDKTQQLPHQKTSTTLIQNLLGQTPTQSQTIFPFLNAPSSEQEYQDMLAKASTILAEAKAQLTKATTSLTAAQALKSTTSRALATAQATLVTAQQALQSAQTALATAKQSLANAQANSSTALQSLQEADALLIQQTQITQTAQAALATAQTNLTSATSNLQTAQNTRASAQANVATKQSAYAQAQQATLTALAQLQTAQYNYDSSSIPNPNYVAPSYTTQPTTYQIPDNNFMTGQPWIGDGSGSQGQPEVHPGHLHFSYIGTEVYQDVLISPRQIANYTFTVGIWNQDQNSINRGPVADTYSLRIYFYDADNNLIHQDSVTSSEVHSWRDVTLQGNTNTTTPVSKVRIGIYGIDNGFWGGTYGPAANNVRLLLGWITGSTQGSTTTGTMQVDIGEGGESTFVAPNGGIFTSSNLRYESYSDPSCGANVTPNNLGGNTIQLVADNSVWDDPCGGQQKHLVGTLTYSSSEPQFIKDPNLLLQVQSSEANLTSAQQAEQTAQQNLAAATAAASTSNVAVTSAQGQLSAAQTSYDSALTTYDAAALQLNTAKLNKLDKQTSYDASLKVQGDLTNQVSGVELQVQTATTTEQTAQTQIQRTQTEDYLAAQEVSKLETSISTATISVTQAQSELDSIKPYVPPVEEKPTKVELPPLEDLTKVNFEEIKATDLTSAQAEQLKEAALQTFETATQGSPEYNAALEALFVAAQQDDIVVDPALAAIPGLGQAAEAAAAVLNLLSNVGADISPEAREDAQQATVAAVIVGQVAQAAMASAMMRRP